MMNTTSPTSTALPTALFDAAGFAIDHVDSFLVVIAFISAVCFAAILLDNDDGWNIWRMFFADIDNDGVGAFGRKKHGYRGGFGVSYGGGDTGLWGLFRALNWVASATFLHSATTFVQSNAAATAAGAPALVTSFGDLVANPMALRCAMCLAYLFAFFGLSVVTTAPGFWADSGPGAAPNRPQKRVLSAELVVGASTILYGVCATESATTRAVLGAGLCALFALRQAQH